MLLVGQVDTLEDAGGIVDFARTQAEPVLAAEHTAERGEVAGQVAEGIHQRPGRTVPTPKSVARPYPPPSEAAGASAR